MPDFTVKPQCQWVPQPELCRGTGEFVNPGSWQCHTSGTNFGGQMIRQASPESEIASEVVQPGNSRVNVLVCGDLAKILIHGPEKRYQWRSRPRGCLAPHPGVGRHLRLAGKKAVVKICCFCARKSLITLRRILQKPIYSHDQSLPGENARCRGGWFRLIIY
jgi:hypothetical protein